MNSKAVVGVPANQPHAITAFAYDTKIDIFKKLPDYGFAIDSEDPNKTNFYLIALLKQID